MNAGIALGDALARKTTGSFDGCDDGHACPDHRQALDQLEAGPGSLADGGIDHE